MIVNKLCCELNTAVRCEGCGMKWCMNEPEFNIQWSEIDFSHKCLDSREHYYACPIAGKVKNTYTGSPTDITIAVLAPLEAAEQETR